MIRHYDMVTGAVIDEEPQDPPQLAWTADDARAALRLQTLDEALAERPQPRRMPPDIARLPIECLIEKWG